MKRNARRFRERLKEDLKDPEFRRAFEDEEFYASLAIQISRMREKEHLTQRELARKLHTTQQTISRLENVHNASYALSTLLKLARVFHKQLRIEFV